MQEMAKQVIDAMIQEVYEVNKDNGWFDASRTIEADLLLIISEVVEALEAYRDQGMDRVLAFGPSSTALKPEGVGPEMADVLIRVLDFCKRYDIDLHAEYSDKLTYNRTRGYRHGGKRL